MIHDIPAVRFRPVYRAPARVLFAVLLAVTMTAVSQEPSTAKSSETSLQITRPARPWEFLSAVGRRAALFGNEAGTVEAWVYPLKLMRDFQLVFYEKGHSIPAASLARTIIARPEAVTLVYSGDDFAVRETFFVPRDESGAIIVLDVVAHQPLEIEARFRRDFELMWPAALGGTYIEWSSASHAFVLGEEQKKWFALIGSATANAADTEYENNYSFSEFSSLHLETIAPPGGRELIVMAASASSRADAESTYQRLANGYDDLRSLAAREYTDYLQNTTSLQLPDANLQSAYDWARVSVSQGLVTNPFLGTGLVAGYRTSGAGQRPGFAWFFGRDALWTSLALDSEGDFATVRTALDFLMKYQRADGKVEHEISQSATLVPWFQSFPYAYASADATPLLLIAAADYLHSSGDTQFVQAHWDNLSRAYRFLRSTWDAHGFAQDAGVGHGWIEGGPLLPVKAEFYQSGLGVEAVRAFAELAQSAGHPDSASENGLFQQQRARLNEIFWDPEQKFFAYALDENDHRIDTPSVLTTVPMWFGLTEPEKSDWTIDRLADADHNTDWGMRIISAHEPRFDPSGYHFGSVWPLFTGWAAVGEYRYHRPLAAYANLRANSLLALDGSPGHVTEVLSGAFFEPLSTSSPHQIWSSAMVISPLLRGMLGLRIDAVRHRITLAPHAPANWRWWKAAGIRMGSATCDVAYSSTADAISLAVTPRQAQNATLDFSPALSPNAAVLGVELNGAKWQYSIEKNSTDLHVLVHIPLDKPATVQVHVRDNFGLAVPADLPGLGESSHNIKVVDESWDAANARVVYTLAGLTGQEYVLPLSGGARIVRTDGASLIQTASGPALRIHVPSFGTGYQHVRVTIQLSSTR